MSERFKVGDRVAAVYPCTGYYPAGAVGTVRAVHNFPATTQAPEYQVDFDEAPGVRVAVDGARLWWAVDVEAAPMTCKVSAHKAEYRARANDPATSKGQRKVNKYESAVLTTLSIKSLGRTGKEIAEYTGHPLNCITPRFAPLRRKGLIKDSGIKRDKQIVWVLA